MPIAVRELSYVDGATVVGDGSFTNPLRVIGAAVAGTVDAFQYTVTGAEPDLNDIVIPLPVVRASTAYGVVAMQQQFTNLLAMGIQTASKTVAQFTLSLSGFATAGDVFTFFITDL